MQDIHLNLKMKCQWKNAYNIIDQTFKITSSEKEINKKYSNCQYFIQDSFHTLESAIQVPTK